MSNIFTVRSRGILVEIDRDKLSDTINNLIFENGLTQKLGDAGAGALKVFKDTNADVPKKAKLEDLPDEQKVKVAEIGKNLMEKVRDNLEAGEWGTIRGTGAGWSELDLAVMKIVMASVKGSDPAWWKDAKLKDKQEACMAAYVDSPDVQKASTLKMAEGRVKRTAEEKAELAELAFAMPAKK